METVIACSLLWTGLLNLFIQGLRDFMLQFQYEIQSQVLLYYL